MSSQKASCDIDYSRVLDKIVTLWTGCGAQLRNAPEYRSYFLRQTRSPGFRLYLEYGVPLRVYTPDSVIEIRTTIHGKVATFAREIMKLFDIRSIEPDDIDVTKLDKSINHYSSMTLELANMKC